MHSLARAKTAPHWLICAARARSAADVSITSLAAVNEGAVDIRRIPRLAKVTHSATNFKSNDKKNVKFTLFCGRLFARAVRAAGPGRVRSVLVQLALGQFSPATLERRSVPFVSCHISLQRSAIRIVAVPEERSPVVIRSCLIVTRRRGTVVMRFLASAGGAHWMSIPRSGRGCPVPRPLAG